MATAQAMIDLSTIPVPDAVVVPDSTELVTELISKYQEIDTIFTAILESDPSYKLSEAFAYRLVLARQTLNDAVRAVLLASAGGGDLDQIGANFDVARMVITPADDSTVPPTDAVYESDEDFRERIQLAWSKLSTAGAKNSYHYFALSADPDVLDVRAYGPETHDKEGRVYLYVLSRTGDGTAPQSLLDIVKAAVNPEEVRPLTDFVFVYSAELIKYEVEADVVIPYGLDGELVMQQAEEALEAYVESVHRIDSVAARSGIDRALHQSGVVTVKLISPAADVEPKMGEAPYCTKITLRKVVTDYD